MIINPVNLVFLPMLFFLGIVTSYEDFKIGKIRNKWIRLALFWGFSSLILFSLWDLVAAPLTRFVSDNVFGLSEQERLPIFTVHADYIWKTLLNFLASVVVSYSMWRFNIWAAGDAKLFIAYSLLLPITFYWKNYFPFFPALSLLINIFVTILLIMLAKSIYDFVLESFFGKKSVSAVETDDNKSKVAKIDPKSMTPIFLVVLIFSLYRDTITAFTGVDALVFQVFVFSSLIIFGKKISPFLAKKSVFLISLVLVVSLCATSLWTDFSWAAGKIIESFIMLAFFSLAFSLFGRYLMSYIDQRESRRCRVDDLKVGTSLSVDTVMLLGFESGEYQARLGLTEENLTKIKERCHNGGISEVCVYQTFPFALWMFVGVLLTLATEQSLVTYLVEILKR
jgi:hypothetical protein